MARCRSVLPKPKEPPEGFMFWHGHMMRVENVEVIAERIMAGFDNLPPATRRAINAVPVWPHKAGIEVARRGDRAAAQSIIENGWNHVFKTRDRTGVHL